MKEGQKAIYYVTADTYAAAANSPHLEIFRKKGIEVLLLSDRIDEWVAGTLTEFDGKPLRSVAKGALDLGELADAEEKKAQEEEADAFKPLIERIKKALGERVKEVRVTLRLTDSPACLVVGEGELSGNLERLLKTVGQKAPTTVPVLEINPHHALVSAWRRSATTSFAIGRACCSTRRCWPKARSSRIPPASCGGSTR